MDRALVCEAEGRRFESYSERQVMESEYVTVVPTGWEWECPKCGCSNGMSRYEFDGMQPVVCSGCDEEFMGETV